MLRHAWFMEEEVRMDITFLVALEKGADSTCRVSELFFFFESLYFSAAGGDVWFMRLVFKFLCM